MKSYSIILPVRNGGAYVKECVRSILAQTHTDFELVILDNNSSDGTTAYIESIKDSRIVHHRSNTDLSMPDNWKRALDLSTNEYITFIGHDDLLYPDYLSEMDALITQNPDASLYQTHFDYINSAGGRLRPCKPMPAILTAGGYLKGEFTQSLDSMGTGFLFRAKDFKKFGGYDYSIPNLLFSDFKLYTQLSGFSFQAISPKTCFAYRVHNSLSITTNVDLYRQAFEKYMIFLKDYQQTNQSVSETIRDYGAPFLQSYCRSLSHRLLKAPIAHRKRVRTFVNDCKTYARWLGIDHQFTPYKTDFTILLASLIDSNQIMGNLYRKIRKF